MYESLDAVGIAVASAEGAAQKDREKYAPFLGAGEAYAREHRMIVGGDGATRLLLGRSPGIGDYHLELHSPRALADARALADKFYGLAPEGLGHYAQVVTDTPNREFTVVVDERPLVKVKALAPYRGANPLDMILPEKKPGSFSKGELLCMGAEIQLYATYAALCDPARVGEWGALLEAEKELRRQFDDDAWEKLSGARAEKAGGRGSAGPSSAGRLLEALRREYVPKTGHVVVGGHGARALLGGKGRKGRLQLVTANTFPEEEEAVRRIATPLGLRVASDANPVTLPGCGRLRQMTIYLAQPGESRKAILDLYDSGEYELIPSLTERRGGWRVGTPFAIMRYLLVDVWTMQLLHRMGVTKLAFANAKIRELLGVYSEVAAGYERLLAAGKFEEIFPAAVERYAGRRVDPVLDAKRRRFAKKGKYYPPYFPARMQKKG